MFERFTERARKVMSIARQEAQRLNSEFIGTEHMLLAIIQEGGGVAAKVLKKLNIDSKQVRIEVDKLITPAAAPSVTMGQLPFSPRAKRVIELAGEAASQLGHDVIGTEHILFGLLKENEGIAAQVLVKLGLKLDKVRDEILEALGAPIAPTAQEADPASPIGYVITFTDGLDQKKVDQVLEAVRLLKGVSKVEKIRGIWMTDSVFEKIKKTIKSEILPTSWTGPAAVEVGFQVPPEMTPPPEEKKDKPDGESPEDPRNHL